jgi:hypothetical protein
MKIVGEYSPLHLVVGHEVRGVANCIGIWVILPEQRLKEKRLDEYRRKAQEEELAPLRSWWLTS